VGDEALVSLVINYPLAAMGDHPSSTIKISGLAYHERVSYDRATMTGHRLDWEHQPSVYKAYPGIEPVRLPQRIAFPQLPLSRVLKDPHAIPPCHRPDLDLLSSALQLAYGLTAMARHAGGDHYYRSAASAGALYPAELYVAVDGMARLPDGLYHFSVAHHGLSPLRPGPYPVKAQRKTPDLDTTRPVLRFFITAIFFRSAWKYRDRSYRYHLLDAGHVAENLVLALTALGLERSLVLDFDDHAVNRYLGVDPHREVCLAVCRSPGDVSDDTKALGETADPEKAVRDASRVAQREVDYPLLRDIHQGGTAIVRDSQGPPPMSTLVGPVPREWRPLGQGRVWPETFDCGEAVIRRRSRRNFAGDPIPEPCLDALLEGLCAGPYTHPEEGAVAVHPFVAVGFLIGRADGWAPGFYLLDPVAAAYGLIAPGYFLDRMAHVCLDQMWLARAGVHLLFLSNLEVVDRFYGPRGYRYAMITAGRLGERLYLMATAMGLGCCGIGAFYDAEAARLLGLDHESRLLYLVAMGRTTNGRPG
jgi:SagB-type dehydrogenase family enzyme